VVDAGRNINYSMTWYREWKVIFTTKCSETHGRLRKKRERFPPHVLRSSFPRQAGIQVWSAPN